LAGRLRHGPSCARIERPGLQIQGRTSAMPPDAPCTVPDVPRPSHLPMPVRQGGRRLLARRARQGLATLRVRQCLRNETPKPFAENYFRSLKGSSKACRYGLCSSARKTAHVASQDALRSRLSVFEPRNGSTAPRCNNRVNRGIRPKAAHLRPACQHTHLSRRFPTRGSAIRAAGATLSLNRTLCCVWRSSVRNGLPPLVRCKGDVAQ
jgi:hypothetical protein